MAALQATKPNFLMTVMSLLLLSSPTIDTAWGVLQTCTEPYCGGNEPIGQQSVLANSPRLTPAAHNKPPCLDNPALLNLAAEASSDTLAVTSAFAIAGTQTTQIGASASDDYGNLYITGGFTGTLDLSGTVLTSSGGFDFYVAKLDPNGQALWARTARGDASVPADRSLEGGLSLAVDANGCCYVGGGFVKSLSFLDANEATVATLTDGRDDDRINFELFIARYDPDGALLWARGGDSGSVGDLNTLGNELNSVTSLLLDSEGYPYIGGAFSGQNFLGEPVEPQGASDFYLASLDMDTGDPLWVHLVGTPDFDGVVSLSIDDFGFINTLGYIGQGEMVFPDSNATWVNDTGDLDTFVMSFDINGEWFFASIMGGDEDVVGRDVASDADGNIFVTGDFEGLATFVGSDIALSAPGSLRSGYLVKYDINGDALWARKIGGHGAVSGSRVVVDDAGFSYVLGMFSHEVVFDEESGDPLVLFPNGETDQFIAAYDPDGRFEWVIQINGQGTESQDQIFSPVVRATTNPTDLLFHDRSLILSGDFDKEIDFGTFSIKAEEGSRAGFGVRIELDPIDDEDAPKDQL